MSLALLTTLHRQPFVSLENPPVWFPDRFSNRCRSSFVRRCVCCRCCFAASSCCSSSLINVACNECGILSSQKLFWLHILCEQSFVYRIPVAWFRLRAFGAFDIGFPTCKFHNGRGSHGNCCKIARNAFEPNFTSFHWRKLTMEGTNLWISMMP